MANTLPNEIVSQLITSTASGLRCSPESVQLSLDTLDDYDIVEVIEAMQALYTADADTIRAYLSGEALLDGTLDNWLDEVG